MFLIDKYGFFGLFGGDIMEGITPIAGGDSDFAKKYPDSKRINVLILGQNQGLTDTIMLASFDTEIKRVDLVSVPRDTYYEQPDHPGAAWQKINSVYKGAGGMEDTDKGAVAMAKAVSEVLSGVPIHFYEIYGDDDIKKIVDAMGGVEIDVPMDMKYTDKKQKLYINLKKGKQKLDGDQAVQFLRFRKGYAMGDLGRVEAQQSFMKEAFKQSIGFGFPKVAKTVMDNVASNMTGKLAVRIGSAAVGMDTKDMKTYMTPGEAQNINRASYYIVDEPKTDKLMNKIYSMKPPEEKTN
ncbi:MAG: LCP family protein [Clostridiales Family XIII bacterium]|jgi:LCP family protein required for cell wall assembly|nr:LCP family protein [Clostridiales Family XIII bacterium]